MNTILVDLGNVISTFNYEKVDLWLKQKGQDPNEVQRVYGRYSHDILSGRLTEADAWTKVNKTLGTRINPRDFYEFRYQSSKIDERVLAKVREMRKRGYRTVLVTDLTPTDYKHFRTLPLWNEFDDHIVSCDVGMTKDNPEYWEFVLDRIQSKPFNVLLIDDLSVNIKAAESVGIQGIKYNKYEDISEL